MKNTIIGWWSAGITSAVACKIALEIYEDPFQEVELIYIEAGNFHPDNLRFKADCEKWYNRPIRTVYNSSGYENQIDVVIKTRYVNGPNGARCTQELKKRPRIETEAMLNKEDKTVINQIFGFEYNRREVNRAIRFLEQYPEANALFPLIDKGMDKDACAGYLINAGIEIPEMYKMGYPNNNCIGCIKGGKGYWNKIRKDFPAHFHAMASAERVAGHSCIKGQFLDELDPSDGKDMRIVMPNCGLFCDVEFADIEDVSLDAIMAGYDTIYSVGRSRNFNISDYE